MPSLLVILLSIILSQCALDGHKQEKQKDFSSIEDAFDLLESCSMVGDYDYHDSLFSINRKIIDVLQHYMEHHDDQKKLQEISELKTLTSEGDNKLFLTSWNSYLGGTTPTFINMISYKEDGGIGYLFFQDDYWTSKKLPFEGANCEFESITALRADNGDQLYLFNGIFYAYGTRVWQSVDAYQLGQSGLLLTYHIFNYESCSLVEEYDASLNEEMLPVVIRDEGKKIRFPHYFTDKQEKTGSSEYTDYSFNGSYFMLDQ